VTSYVRRTWTAAIAAALFGAAPAAAQVFTPPFMSPVPRNDFGVYVSSLGDIAIEGLWERHARGGSGMGLRAGYTEWGDGSLLLGLQVVNPVQLAGTPIGLAFTASGQAVVGGANGAGGQVGFTAGGTIPSTQLGITPYIHPRLAVVSWPGSDDDLRLRVLADFGVDLDLLSGMSIRIGANLGDGASIGVGVAWRQ
jgi:hypothetical protein